MREVPSSEVEKRTPGLEVYRYDVKVPPGHEVEFFSQLFVKKPEARKQHWGTAGVLRSDGTFELRLQKGETLNPDLKGKLRWDVRTEFGGVSTTSGGWIDDPIAARGDCSRFVTGRYAATSKGRAWYLLTERSSRRDETPGEHQDG